MNPTVATLIRWALSTLGALLVNKGWIDNATLQTVIESITTIVGLVLVLIPMFTSIWPRVKKADWKTLAKSMIRYAMGIGGATAIYQALNVDQASAASFFMNIQALLGAAAVIAAPIWSAIEKWLASRK